MRFLNYLQHLVPLSNATFHHRMNSVDDKFDEIAGSLERANQDFLTLTRQFHEFTTSEIKQKKSYYLICEPGYPNYGDELIAREWLKYLARNHPDIPVYLDCARPGPATAILRDIHPHMQIVDTISRLTAENVYADTDSALIQVAKIGQFVHDAMENEGAAARYAAGIELLRSNVRSVHFLGGGYMNSTWPINLARLALGKWCADEDIPVIATGIGLMPLNQKDLVYVRGILDSFAVFSTRDEETYKALIDGDESDGPDSKIKMAAAASVILGPDDCFVNALKGCYAPEQELPETMVCIQSDLVQDIDALYQHVLGTLSDWGVTSGATVGVVECNPYIDYPIVPVLESAGYHVRFFPLDFLLREGFPARPGQRWLTTRYHPHILASAKGCSGSFISVSEQYYGVKHRAVLRMGSHWTNSVIGGSGVKPGPGFVDDNIPERYSRQIRETVDQVYRG